MISFLSFNLSPHRPFKRQRPNLFNLKKWENFFSDIWSNIGFGSAETQIQKSLLGKVVTYAGSELCCSIAGGMVGKHLIGKLVSELGRRLLYPGLINVALLGMAGISFKVSKAAKVIFILIAAGSTTLLISYSKLHIDLYGANSGLPLGEAIGYLAGTILGGFGGLYIAGSNAALWDKDNPRGSYLTGMLRFVATGGIFDTFITTSIPYAGPFYSIPRTAVKSILQTLAFSSDTILPMLKNLIKHSKKPRKILTPFLVQLITNRFSRSQGTIQPITKEISTKIFFALRVLPSILEKSIRIGVEFGLGLLVNKQNANVFVTVALRSVHQYFTLLRQNPDIINAEQNLRKSFLDLSIDRKKAEEDLAKSLSNAIKQPNSYSKSVLLNIVDRILKDEDIQELTNSLVANIQKLEIEVIGIHLLNSDKAAYLKKLSFIYLKNYLYFVLQNWEGLTEKLTPSTEQEIVFDIGYEILSSYFSFATPQKLAKLINSTTKTTLQTALKTREFIIRILKEPEHTEHLIVPSNPILESYFPAPKNDELETQEFVIIDPQIEEKEEASLKGLNEMIDRLVHVELKEHDIKENHFATTSACIPESN